MDLLGQQTYDINVNKFNKNISLLVENSFVRDTKMGGSGMFLKIDATDGPIAQPDFIPAR